MTKISTELLRFETVGISKTPSHPFPLPWTCGSTPPLLAFHTAIVTVKPPLFAQCLFLLSTALQWAVLINTNASYGCKELKSRFTMQVYQKKKLCEPSA